MKLMTRLPIRGGNRVSDRYVIEALLRPAVELNTAVVSACASYVCVTAPWAIALAPSVSYVMAGALGIFAIKRTREGLRVLRYRRNIRRLPRYVMTSRQVPVSQMKLFSGKGFFMGAAAHAAPAGYVTPGGRQIRKPFLGFIRRRGGLNNVRNIVFRPCAGYWQARARLIR